MNKTLIVTKPYGWMEPGEKFELSDDGKMYVNTHTDEYSCTEDGADMSSKTAISYSISKDFAKDLVDKNILTEKGVVKDSTNDASFKNVFDEIDNMLLSYKEDLDNINEDMKDDPACLKVEKETVLRNMIKTLSYLKSLKK